MSGTYIYRTDGDLLWDFKISFRDEILIDDILRYGTEILSWDEMYGTYINSKDGGATLGLWDKVLRWDIYRWYPEIWYWDTKLRWDVWYIYRRDGEL